MQKTINVAAFFSFLFLVIASIFLISSCAKGPSKSNTQQSQPAPSQETPATAGRRFKVAMVTDVGGLGGINPLTTQRMRD